MVIMLTEQQITELAEGYVCPLGKRPVTPYEINAAKQFAEFARLVLRINETQQAASSAHKETHETGQKA
jgi:hypothetical protein